ncbi:hypothetical protein K461DRAFT_131148 [Myriangium duriaei CBS 260.36]|uniref:Uncharacterized protein n=1 Tax=Myriangium duriaei CBS 260.36 TaxID=1168546 RepID=A0A9P4J2L0_9PEZI|nr:hypothetical protein K461DRAFT_131148 [Myriangium duriaei CBS 260.36]
MKSNAGHLTITHTRARHWRIGSAALDCILCLSLVCLNRKKYLKNGERHQTSWEHGNDVRAFRGTGEVNHDGRQTGYFQGTVPAVPFRDPPPRSPSSMPHGHSTLSHPSDPPPQSTTAPAFSVLFPCRSLTDQPDGCRMF